MGGGLISPTAHLGGLAGTYTTPELPVAYITLEGEGHGFRKAESVVRTLDAELVFYLRVFGIPEVTDVGVKVKYLYDNETTLGGGLRIVSDLNPAVNGDYGIYQLDFEVASREEPFYWTAAAMRLLASGSAISPKWTGSRDRPRSSEDLPSSRRSAQSICTTRAPSASADRPLRA